jgi:ribosomal protein L28
LKIGQSVVVEKTRICLRVIARQLRSIEREMKRKSQIAGKKNPKQLMEAWDLKMHKPWW